MGISSAVGLHSLQLLFSGGVESSTLVFSRGVSQGAEMGLVKEVYNHRIKRYITGPAWPFDQLYTRMYWTRSVKLWFSDRGLM